MIKETWFQEQILLQHKYVQVQSARVAINDIIVCNFNKSGSQCNA